MPSAQNHPMLKWYMLVLFITKSGNLEHHFFGIGTYDVSGYLSRLQGYKLLKGRRSGFFACIFVVLPLKSYPLFGTHGMSCALYTLSPEHFKVI